MLVLVLVTHTEGEEGRWSGELAFNAQSTMTVLSWAGRGEGWTVRGRVGVGGPDVFVQP